jgi:hypothetical protein
MFDLTKDSDIKDLRYDVYNFLNKYGFQDGDRVLKEEREIVEHLCYKLANAIGVVDSRWEPCVIYTGSHNPYYVKFKDLQTGEYVGYYDMEERDRRKIEQRIDEIMGSLF